MQERQQIAQDDSTKRHKYHTQQQPKSNLFFRIIEEGVDNIIVKLKNAIKGYGEDDYNEIETTNDGAKIIFDKLNELSQTIKNEYSGTETAEGIERQLKMSMENAQQPNDGGNYDSNMDVYYYFMKTQTDNSNHKKLANKIQKTEKIPSNNVIEINNRLEACVNLEYLYLKKHEEIINIFSFVLQLFEKYKYAIKVILYLLKNLVRVPSQTSNPLTINLPKPIIKNIFTLVKDQYKIENIVNKMKNVVNDTDISNNEDMKDIDNTTINTNLKNKTTPSALASTA